MNININLAEWGLICKEFDDEHTSTMQPIYGFSFQWRSRAPEVFASFAYENPGVIYGIGEYKFEMRSAYNQAKIQEFFRKQKAIKELDIIRFINQDGEPAEAERYAIKNAVIDRYEFTSKENGAQSYLISIYSNGKDEYIQTIRNTQGLVMGKMVSIDNGLDSLG